MTSILRKKEYNCRLFILGLDACQAVTSPQARPSRPFLRPPVVHCSSCFDYSIQPLSEPLSAKMFGFGNPSLYLWTNDITFSYKSCICWSLTVGDKTTCSFLGHWFCVVVDLQRVCLFPSLSANPLTFYLFEFLLKQERNFVKNIHIKLYFSSG